MTTLLRLLRWLDVHVFGARRCEYCACTDHFACVGGCGWSLYFAAAFGAHVCTRCEEDPAHLAALREVAVARAERACSGTEYERA